jgi:pimeloyl-ACP methyl ester carboxylesterase
MTRAITRNAIARIFLPLSLLAVAGLALAIFFAVRPAHPPKNSKASPSSDNFRLDNFGREAGSLGSNWTNIRDGGLSVSSRVVKGKPGVAGDTWTASTFTSDQYSQIEVTATQLTDTQWIGPAVRVQNGGQDAYVGVYEWNGGKPVLLLYLRSKGNWIRLGSGYSSGPLATGTQLRITAVGVTISLLENGIQRLSVSNRSLSGGAPGIMMYGAGTAGSWRGGNASPPPAFRVTYMSTDADGVKSYQVISPYDGPDPQAVRVLAPTHPAAGVRHNFLFVLTVQPGLGRTYSDGLETLRKLDAQDKYNLTIIEPTFGIDPWYADNPKNPNIRYETFMTKELVPWVERNLAVTGHEQNWLIGFSRSGLGGQDLILKHPDIFSLAASWDFPAQLSSYEGRGGDTAAAYGTNANFQANYRLTAAFLKAHSGPFVRAKRIWIGGGAALSADMVSYAKLLTKEGLLYTIQLSPSMPHRWDSGWVPEAVAALEQDSRKIS